MSVGPIEILMVEFPDNKFTGEIAPALAELVEQGMIRIIDLLFVAKDKDGDVVAVELERCRRRYRRARTHPWSTKSPGCSPTRTSKT